MFHVVDIKNFIGIKSGNTFQNYKELCETLNLPILSGNSKIAQENEIKRYMDFDKIGNKYVVNKVYPTPLPDLSSKGSLYYNLLQLIICKILLNHISEEDNIYRATVNQLAESVGFVNELYFRYLFHKNKLSKQLSVPIDVIEKLYKDSQRNYKSTIYRTLDRMEKDKLLKYQEIYYVQEIIEKNTVILESKNDRYGDKAVKVYQPVDIDGEFRKATENELLIITDIEQKTLAEFDVENFSDLYRLGMADKYYLAVQGKLINKLGIGKYYKVIEIYYIQEGIKKREIALSNAIKELNEKFYDKLIQNKDDDYKKIADKVIRLDS